MRYLSGCLLSLLYQIARDDSMRPPTQIVEITFNVWYRLSEELLRLDESQLSEVFKPYVQRLITHLCVHCQLDEDMNPVSVVG